jgi:hypothetical protein
MRVILRAPYVDRTPKIALQREYEQDIAEQEEENFIERDDNPFCQWVRPFPLGGQPADLCGVVRNDPLGLNGLHGRISARLVERNWD